MSKNTPRPVEYYDLSGAGVIANRGGALIKTKANAPSVPGILEVSPEGLLRLTAVGPQGRVAIANHDLKVDAPKSGKKSFTPRDWLNVEPDERRRPLTGMNHVFETSKTGNKSDHSLKGLARNFFTSKGVGYTLKVNPEVGGVICNYKIVEDVNGNRLCEISKVRGIVDRDALVLEYPSDVRRCPAYIAPDSDYEPQYRVENFNPDPEFDKDWVHIHTMGSTPILHPNHAFLAVEGPSGTGKSTLMREIFRKYGEATARYKKKVDSATSDKIEFIPILIIIGERAEEVDPDEEDQFVRKYHGNVHRLSRVNPGMIAAIVENEIQKFGFHNHFAVGIDSASGLITEATGPAMKGGIPSDARQRIEAVNAIATIPADVLRVFSIFNTPPEGGENWRTGIGGGSDVTLSFEEVGAEPVYARCRILKKQWGSGGVEIQQSQSAGLMYAM